MILINNFLIYITFGILLQFLVEVKPQTITYKPNLREAHTATFINDKLYILGGVIPSSEISPNDTFSYLDFSLPLMTNKLEWHSLSNIIVPSHRYAAAIKGGANNDTLFLYGGESLSDKTMALVYTYDTQNNLWRIPEIKGTPPNKETGVTLTIDDNGLIYLFGGVVSNSTVYTNDMFILDTINLTWKQASSIDAPRPRAQYGAVFLPNKNIIYMGGFDLKFGVFALNEVYLYDTTSDIWTKKETNGFVPSARSSFSSVLGLDGQRVIIFGGLGNNSTNISPAGSLYVLGINNFNWYIPEIRGKIPSSRAFHKTVTVGKYMVVTFGKGYTKGNESDILLLDISDNEEYVWIDPNSLTNNKLIISAIIGSSVGVVLLLIGSFFLYKWYKKGQNKVLPTPEDGKNDNSQETAQK